MEDFHPCAWPHRADRKPARAVVEMRKHLRRTEFALAALYLDGFGLPRAGASAVVLICRDTIAAEKYLGRVKRDNAAAVRCGRRSDVIGVGAPRPEKNDGGVGQRIFVEDVPAAFGQRTEPVAV
jgi:hypothetical protein